MTTAQAKFDFSPMGVSPVVNSANMPMLAPRDVMGGAPIHMRRHSGAGVTPPIAIHTKVLADNPSMAHAAFELSQAHYSAEAGGLDSPSRSAIAEQTLPLAESVGLRDQPLARPVGDFAAKVGNKRKPS